MNVVAEVVKREEMSEEREVRDFNVGLVLPESVIVTSPRNDVEVSSAECVLVPERRVIVRSPVEETCELAVLM